jgi:hypothetical protein
MKNVPTRVLIFIGACFITVVAAFVILTVSGSDSAEFSRWLNSIANLAGLLLGGGAMAFAGQAAQQTNGGLDKRIEDGARRALDEQRGEDIGKRL